ncbi:MAG TPA: glutamate-1-semialdehyde 2,1-aminomutase [Candidatus Thermoplasmatota archaeon]|jgi:glutamate-1-semialdehyde 2,1-aminomutase|nr:glutamate-1-semialdehyde 2,1-aminomutase [Candidatus Thermoplasmatota archaeon]
MSSRELWERAAQRMPGGVSSPVRLFQPHPLFFARGEGARLYDVDGHGYVDYNLGFGPLILGHADPVVTRAVQEQAARGTLFGAPSEGEVALAELVSRLVPSVEMLRFASTGTEAAMHALRLARAHTGRDAIVKVDGGFHGSSDSLLVKAGSGAQTFGVPSSAGVPAALAKHTMVVPYNDLAALEAALRSKTVAAVILEPVLANIGPIPPQAGYLEGARKLTREQGALLIFDEVVTGFRLALGGAQQHYGVRADLTLLGKVLGGGLPLAAFGGRHDLMQRIAPLGDVYQAGTFSGNPLSVAAGLATLTELERRGLDGLSKEGERLARALGDVAHDRRAGIVQGVGSLFQLFLTPGPVRDAAEARRADGARFLRLHAALLTRGVYLPPSQWETCFLSLAHARDDIDRTVEAFDACLGSLPSSA